MIFLLLKNLEIKENYSKILQLIKNLNTNKKFWIYCLSNNYSKVRKELKTQVLV